jgi:hypothetical protein
VELGVGVAVGVSVGVGVLVKVGVKVGVGVDVAVLVKVGVGVEVPKMASCTEGCQPKAMAEMTKAKARAPAITAKVDGELFSVLRKRLIPAEQDRPGDSPKSDETRGHSVAGRISPLPLGPHSV